MGCMLAWRFALFPYSKRSPSLNPDRGLSVWSLHVLPMLAWVFGGYSSFLLQSNDMHGRSTGDSRLPIGVNVSVHGCLSTCGPVMDWQPVQGGPLALAQRELG